MKTTFIYALCEPGTRTVRYIGKSATPKKRMRQHLKESVLAKTHLGHWLRSLSLPPDMIIFRELPGDGSEAEKGYIRLAKRLKMNLVNGTEGGDGGSGSPSTETREKVSRALKGRFSGSKNPFFGQTHTLKSKEAMGAPHRGCPLPAGHPLIGWAKGKVRSEEHCLNLSKTHVGMLGKKHSEETRAAMSLAQKARQARNRKEAS